MIIPIRENAIEDTEVLNVLKAIAAVLYDLVIHPISSGDGTPEASITAGIGSIYLRTDGGSNTTLYVKETGTGNTGWVAK